MTRVDFYQLNDPASDAHLRVSCKLVKRALKDHQQIFLQVPDARTAEKLDALLWEFEADAFIPHVLLPRDDAQAAPICIGVGAAPEHHADVLINLCDDIPLRFERFARVCELVPASDEHRNKARERYKHYKDRGYPLHYHQLAAGA